MPLRPLATLCALLVAAALAGCSGSAEQKESAQFRDAPIECEFAPDNRETPAPAQVPSLLSTECAWEAKGRYIGTADGILITLFHPRRVARQKTKESDDNWYRLRGYDRRTGEMLWQGEKLTTTRSLTAEILHASENGASYVAVFDLESGSRARGASEKEKLDQLSISFYPVKAQGDNVEAHTTHVPPLGYTLLDDLGTWIRSAQDAQLAPANIILTPPDPEKKPYIVVNPATGHGAPTTAPQHPEGGEFPARWRYSAPLPSHYDPLVAAVGQERVLTQERMWNPEWSDGKVYSMRDSDQTVLWNTLENAPESAMKAFSVLSGIYKNYAVFWWYEGKWDQPSPEHDNSRNTPVLVSLHDLSTGEMLTVEQTRVEGDLSATDVPMLTVSAEGNFLASQNIVFDLRDDTVHTILDPALEVTSVSETTAYAIDHREGTRSEPLQTAIDLRTGATVWQARDGHTPFLIQEKTSLFERGTAERGAGVVAFPSA